MTMGQNVITHTERIEWLEGWAYFHIPNVHLPPGMRLRPSTQLLVGVQVVIRPILSIQLEVRVTSNAGFDSYGCDCDLPTYALSAPLAQRARQLRNDLTPPTNSNDADAHFQRRATRLTGSIARDLRRRCLASIDIDDNWNGFVTIKYKKHHEFTIQAFNEDFNLKALIVG